MRFLIIKDFFFLSFLFTISVRSYYLSENANADLIKHDQSLQIHQQENPEAKKQQEKDFLHFFNKNYTQYQVHKILGF